MLGSSWLVAVAKCIHSIVRKGDLKGSLMSANDQKMDKKFWLPRQKKVLPETAPGPIPQKSSSLLWWRKGGYDCWRKVVFPKIVINCIWPYWEITIWENPCIAMRTHLQWFALWFQRFWLNLVPTMMINSQPVLSSYNVTGSKPHKWLFC